MCEALHPHICVVIFIRHCSCFVRLQAASGTQGYKPPAYDTLRTTLLADAKKRVNKKLRLWEERTDTTGCTICCDGWSDVANRPLLNILAVNPKGAKFIDAVDTSGEIKSAEFIASVIIEAIEAVGPTRVVQVVTDNAANCRSAGKIIMEK